MGKIAFLFSGQGAQYEGMGRSLCDISPAARELYSLADSVRPGTSDDCFTRSKAELSVTSVTQPTLFCVDLAAGLALRERGVTPHYAAGFSLGEIPALAFCGYLSHEQAFRFVIRRGVLMEQCASEHPGEMYAVMRIGPETVETIASTLEGVYPVNYNSADQTVVACAAGMGEALSDAVKSAGGKALKLAVSGAFHTPFMNAASQALAGEFVSLELAAANIPCVSNVSALPYEDVSLMFRQVNSPVRWQRTIEYLAAQGVDTFVECGPGKVLTGLVRKICPEATTVNVENEETLTLAMEVLEDAQR